MGATPSPSGIGGPTAEERIRLRRAQMLGVHPSQVPLQEPETDNRREYKSQTGVNYSEPRHLPPRMDLRKPNALPDVDLDQVDPDERTASLDRIAAISAGEATLVKVDNTITEAIRVTNNLMQACRELEARAAKEGRDDLTHYTQQMRWITEEALLPWLQEIDNHFDQVLAETTEVAAETETTPPQNDEGELNG